MIARLLLLSVALLCLLVSPAVAGRKAKWTGPINTNGKTGYVVVTGQLSASCDSLKGRWKCSGPGCVKKSGRLRMGCGGTGSIGRGASRCGWLDSGSCGPGLRDQISLFVNCPHPKPDSRVLLTRQPTRTTPSCTPR